MESNGRSVERGEGARSAAVPVSCRDEDSCDALDLRLSRSWLRIGIAGVFAGQGMMFSLAVTMTPPAYGTTPYLILHGGLIFSSLLVMAFLGGPLFAATWSMLRSRRVSIEGLFTLSLLGAFVGSVVGSLTGEGEIFYEVVAIVVAIYTFGRMLGERSVERLKLESARLRERFDRALVRQPDGRWAEQGVAALAPGADVRVAPGAPICVDGRVVEGVAFVEEKALTGEPLPVVRRPGDRVRAGTWSIDGVLRIRAEAAGGARELDEILAAVDASDGRPSELQIQANHLMQIFLPIVVCVSAGTALFWAWWGSWMDAVLNSMAVLLVACPCALGLATPVAIAQGLFRLSRLGLVSRDGALVDALAHTRHLFFDKTGTLSDSQLAVAEMWLREDGALPRDVLLQGIAASEAGIAHPVARALCSFLAEELKGRAASDAAVEAVEVLSGRGLRCRLRHGGSQRTLEIGEAELGDAQQLRAAAAPQLHSTAGKKLYAWVDGELAGCFVLREQAREGLAGMWPKLEALGVKVSVLTGDPNPQLELPSGLHVDAGLSAAAKLKAVVEAERRGDVPVFIGDGVNDTAAMRAARASIAMGSGTALAQSSASGRLIADRIDLLPQAIEMTRGLEKRLRGNLIYAAGYNGIGMLVAAGGLLHPVIAAVIMLVSSFWVTFRATGSFPDRAPLEKNTAAYS